MAVITGRCHHEENALNNSVTEERDSDKPIVLTTALSSFVPQQSPNDSVEVRIDMESVAPTRYRNSIILGHSLREKLGEARRRINDKIDTSKGKDNLDSPECSRRRIVIPWKGHEEKIEERKPQGHERREANAIFEN